MKIVFKSEHRKREFLKFINYINTLTIDVKNIEPSDNVSIKVSKIQKLPRYTFCKVKRIKEFLTINDTEINNKLTEEIMFWFDSKDQKHKIEKYFKYLKQYVVCCDIHNKKTNVIMDNQTLKTGYYTLNRYKQDKMFNILTNFKYTDNL